METLGLEPVKQVQGKDLPVEVRVVSIQITVPSEK